jgi:hypothetical protein
MLLAVIIIRQNPQLKIRRITRIYKVLYSILYIRIHSTPVKRDTINKAQKLTKLEEETIVRYILDLDSRAFPSRRSVVEDIVNQLLAIRDSRQVRKN